MAAPEKAMAPLRKRESIIKKLNSGRRKRQSTGWGEEKWVYKGHVDLLDLEIVVPPPLEAGEQRRFEVLSPKKSFALYAGETRSVISYDARVDRC